MLTNTVILFLRDLLPIFIMFAYVQTIFEYQKAKTSQLSIIIGVALAISILVLLFFENLGDLFEGTGIEWLKVSLIFVSFICFLLSHNAVLFRYRAYLLGGAIVSLLALHFISFLLYFFIYFVIDDVVIELIIGCAIGIGICISFYFLFSFIVQELWQSKFAWVVLLLWSLFVANQVSNISNFFHQIDLLTLGTSQWVDLSSWIQDNSEYGFILKALVGFDSSPSVLNSVLLVMGFVSMFGFSMLNRHRTSDGQHEQ